MRIGLITPGFSASEEDWCIPAHLDLVRVLAERDEVVVFALRYPHRRETYRVYGAQIRPSGGARRRGLARLPLLLRALLGIVRECRRRRLDVLHALWAHEPGFLAAVAGRLTRTPVVVSILGGELVELPDIRYGGQASPVNRWLVRRSLAGANRVTVPSELAGGLAADRVPAEKVVRRPLGVDLERFHPGPPSPAAPVLDGGPILLHVASLVPVKDQETLLRAFRAVAQRLAGARLHVVGDGELRWELEQEALELGLGERVSWHGAVDHGRLADYYRQADVFVLSSRFESQGMVALEAAACGCPVVGTRVGILPELGAADRLVAPGDAAALGAALTAVLEDRESGARIAAAQKSTVRSELRLAATSERLRRLYAGLAFSLPGKAER